MHELGLKYKVDIYNIDHKCEFPVPPWIKPKFNINLSVHQGPKAQMPLELLKQESLKLISNYSNTLQIYTDGSVSNNRTGIGVFNKSYSECTRLPNSISIYTAGPRLSEVPHCELS